MHGDVRPSLEHGALDFRSKHAVPSELADRPIGVPISPRLGDDDLGTNGRIEACEPLRDTPRLFER